MHFPPVLICSITILGTGAKWLSALEDRQVYPAETHSLQTLHTILSTGSSLKPQSYDYVYSKIKKNVLLGSITGQSNELLTLKYHHVCVCVCAHTHIMLIARFIERGTHVLSYGPVDM